MDKNIELDSFLSEFTVFIELLYKDYLLAKRIEFKVLKWIFI